MVSLTKHPAYQQDFLYGSEALFTTAYFVNPEVICTTGRSEEEFNRDGTGNNLDLQPENIGYKSVQVTD